MERKISFIDNRGITPVLAFYKNGDICGFTGNGSTEDFINAAVISCITIIQNKKLSKEAVIRIVEERINEQLKQQCIH